MAKKPHKPQSKSVIGHTLSWLGYGVIGVVLLGLLVVSSVHSSAKQTPKPVITQKKTTSQTKKSTKITAKVDAPAPAPAPKPTPPPPAPVAAAAPKTIVTTEAAVPQPVVTPAPDSKVSGLTPTASPPATAPASGTGNSTPPPATTGAYTSTNWSGYLSTQGFFTAVSGSWTATSPSGVDGVTSADSTWIGIGGVTSDDLIQVGTYNIVSPSGQVSAAAFYEILPDVSQSIDELPISPGDAMEASIVEVSPNQWNVIITNNTTNTTFTKLIAYTSSHSSAEWIEEDPSTTNNRLIPLDNFGVAYFTNGMATANGSARNIAGNQSLPITMVDRHGQPIGTPSQLNAGGTGFSVSR